jgi:hypothetical protein
MLIIYLYTILDVGSYLYIHLKLVMRSKLDYVLSNINISYLIIKISVLMC